MVACRREKSAREKFPKIAKAENSIAYNGRATITRNEMIREKKRTTPPVVRFTASDIYFREKSAVNIRLGTASWQVTKPANVYFCTS